MRITLSTLAALIMGLGGCHAFAADVCATAANVVTNCGFETGSLTGWTISGTDSAPANNGIYYGVENFNQFSGNDAAYFAALGGEINLSQTITGLMPNFIYTITVEAFNDTTPLGAYVNNIYIGAGLQMTEVASQVSADGYTKYTFVDGGITSSTETLSIMSRNDAGFWNIDSIQMIETASPEPSALALLGIGLVLLTLFCVRGRIQQAFSRVPLQEQR